MPPISTFSLVENQVRRRTDTDRTMSYGMYWLFSILLGVFTLGFGAWVYSIVIYFQILNRRNDHFERQHRLFSQVVTGLREERTSGSRVTTRLSNIEGLLEEMQRTEGRRNPWLWVLLWPLLTFGLASFWTLYWVTVDWHRHAVRQGQITGDLSSTFRELGYTTPNLIDESETPERNYWIHLLLTIVTFNLWFIYWGYLCFKDGNKHMESDHFMEDQLLNTLRLGNGQN